jgi:hypothetical protein
VYQPDWRSAERLAYTTALADLMAEIAPQGEALGAGCCRGSGPQAATQLGIADRTG